jgi:hypothetical protein
MEFGHFLKYRSDNHRHENTLAAHWHGLPALFWLSSYVAGCHLAVVPQSGAKLKFYCIVYYLILNSNCETFKDLKKM